MDRNDYNDSMREQKLSNRMSTLSESATLALNAKAKRMATEGKTIYNLTAGELASETPEYIQEYIATVLNQNKYTAVAGMPELRQAIADTMGAFYGKKFSAGQVVVTAGVKPALYASLLAIINPGDEVIVPIPMWVSYKHLIELAGGKTVGVRLTEEFDLDPDLIEASITSKTRAIILNSPHNPTGAVFSYKALALTAKKLKGKGITVIADDIYSKLVYGDDMSLVPKHDFEQVIIVNGFSKSQALTGWRTGYLIADEKTAAAITSLLSHTMGNTSVLGQQAALIALKQGDKPQDMPQLMKQKALVEKSLTDIPNIDFVRPKGAFYVFFDIRKITSDSAGWCERLLLETGVALVPGEAFETPGFARLSFVADESTLKEALEKIKHFVLRGEGK
jgi:aspartate aminotransferase